MYRPSALVVYDNHFLKLLELASMVAINNGITTWNAVIIDRYLLYMAMTIFSCTVATYNPCTDSY